MGRTLCFVGAHAEFFMQEHSSHITGYPFINFVTTASSIPSFDNLASIIIRISAFLTLPKTTQKGRNRGIIFKRVGIRVGQTRSGRWNYEKNRNPIEFRNPDDLFFRLRTRQHGTQPRKSGHADYVARLRQSNQIAVKRCYQRI